MLSNFVKNNFVASYNNQGARALYVKNPQKGQQRDLTTELTI
jgi:hypothetical protein